ncbi:TPA: protein sok [Escherichia coli]|nr:protein sok [Escherichia coli]MXE45224.1 protein sok [Escherichia sp. HH41S]HAV8205189.1 protein sok [Escherichia coli]HAV8265030.1 protein sok [Escherichia coli]HAV8721412.1 protein sok [Escherichia coli]
MWTRHRDASWWLMKINLLRGYLLSATQHGNKPPSRHEAESLKRRAHHSPYPCTLTTLTFPENNLVVQPVHGQSV